MTKEDAVLYRDRISSFIRENQASAHITGGVDDAAISSAEAELGMRLPHSFRWFLQTYGYLILFRVEILGVGLDGYGAFVRQMQRQRQLGMPENLVMVESRDEYVICLVVGPEDTEDCRVAQWAREDVRLPLTALVPVSDSFYRYLYELLRDAKASWEEDG